jgi:hypothetical protein
MRLIKAYELVPAWSCVDGCAVKAMGEMSGELKSGRMTAAHKRNSRSMYGQGNGQPTEHDTPGDKGTCARFFFNADYTHEQLEQANAVYYCAKASRRERDAGLSGEKRFLATMGDGIGAREHNPKEPTAWVRNIHPCCKPISLTKWLATLLLPPDAYAPRRLLIPFCGSGSECIGAYLAGWEHIVGVELIDEYADIARARLAWWEEAAQGQMFNDVKAILKAAKK